MVKPASNLILPASAKRPQRTLNTKGMLNALWLLVAAHGGKIALKREQILHGIPKNAVLKVEYKGAEDVYVFSTAQMDPSSIVTG